MTNLERQYLKKKAIKHLAKFAKENVRYIQDCWVTSNGTMFGSSDFEHDNAVRYEKSWLLKEERHD